ncbi:MAG: LysE family transporter [Mycobacterium sp.]|nr:LysE family transporter [Mycobacterium sp.]
MPNEIWTHAAAGVLAGLGLAMPMGAIAALLLREGLVNGFRVGSAAAAGVATVDLAYCAVATLTGATLTGTIDDHRAAFLLTSGVLIVAIGVRQLLVGLTRRPRAAREVARASAWRAFCQFVGLTAINPITLVYFAALSGAVSTSDGPRLGSVAFVAAVGAASLGWQLILVGAGSFFGASVNLSAARAIGVIASLLIVALGVVVVVKGLATSG